MHFQGGFPVDIVLLALVAGFLILRLRSVLGRRTGYERPPLPEQPAAQQPLFPRPSLLNNIPLPGRSPPSPPRVLPSPHTVTGQALAEIKAADRDFDPSRFINNAESLFRTIVTAFVQSDLKTLRGLLNPSVFATFEQAIAQRTEAGETQHTEIKSILKTTIEEAEIVGGHAVIVVRFESDQISFTRDRRGEIVSGTESVTEIIDLWTFERAQNERALNGDTAWRLAAARSG